MRRDGSENPCGEFAEQLLTAMITGLDMEFFRRLLVRFFLGIYLINFGGCASTPAPLAPEHRLQLGGIGLLALPSTPSIEFHTFAKGWAACNLDAIPSTNDYRFVTP